MNQPGSSPERTPVQPATPATATGHAATGGLDPELLALLVCPLTHKPLVLRGDELLCYESRKAYRIEDGIPVMLIDEARPIADSELPPEFRGKPPLTGPEP